MPNVSAPKGFIPVRHLDGSAWNGATKDFLVDSGDATALFIGDPVKIAGSAGVAGQIVAGQDVEGMATITRCASGSAEQAFVGVVVGFSVDPNNLMNTSRLALTSRIAHVVVDTTVVYEIQEDGVTSNIAAADIGLNFTFSTTAGSATTGYSGIQLVSNVKTNLVTAPCKLLGLVKRPDNAFGLASTDKAKFEVVFNTGVLMPNVVGA
jgi:hypothetical protein